MLDELEEGRIEPAGSVAVNGDSNGAISLHSATFEELRAVGMSPTQATRTLHYREEGRLSSVGDLDRVPGIPEGSRAVVRKHLKD